MDKYIQINLGPLPDFLRDGLIQVMGNMAS